ERVVPRDVAVVEVLAWPGRRRVFLVLRIAERTLAATGREVGAADPAAHHERDRPAVLLHADVRSERAASEVLHHARSPAVHQLAAAVVVRQARRGLLAVALPALRDRRK